MNRRGGAGSSRVALPRLEFLGADLFGVVDGFCCVPVLRYSDAVCTAAALCAAASFSKEC